MNPMDLRRGIQSAVDAVVKELEKLSTPIKEVEEISNVATISANGDKQIGEIIGGIFDKLGHNGTITVADGKTLDTEVEYFEGIRWDRGYVSPYFVTDAKNQKIEMEDALILLLDKKLSQVQPILKLLEHAMQQTKNILIVAEDIESDALATLVVNKLRGGLKVAAVKSPGFGDNRKNTMQDIAIATGATFISEEIGMNLEDAEPTVLGLVKKVIIDKDETIMLGGNGASEDIAERVDMINE